MQNATYFYRSQICQFSCLDSCQLRHGVLPPGTLNLGRVTQRSKSSLEFNLMMPKTEMENGHLCLRRDGYQQSCPLSSSNGAAGPWRPGRPAIGTVQEVEFQPGSPTIWLKFFLRYRDLLMLGKCSSVWSCPHSFLVSLSF
jgi:hypothetical protein